jgi:S1-C subfamily serine protease
MKKILDYIEQNANKIIFTAILILVMFFVGLFISHLNNEVQNIKRGIVVLANSQTYLIDQNRDAQDKSDVITTITFKALEIIIEQIEDLAKTQQYIIDQNREKIEKETTILNKIEKPTYEEIRSHSVWIEGCSGGKDHDNEVSFPVGENGMCWGGTGVVIKVTDTDTYILTNNHVTGKGQKDVKLYVENDKIHKLVKAEIIAQHSTVDAAVIKIKSELPNKKAIPGIATAQIQDPVYVVGNPLAIRDVYTEGIVAGYEGVSMLIQMPCIYGNSGSGVFNQRGQLVGLVFALEMYHGFMGIPEARITHSLVVDSVSIRTFLKDLGLYE